MTPDEIRKAEMRLAKKELGKTFAENESLILKQYIALSARDFMYFLRGLTIDGQTGPRVFDSVMEEFQRECFETIAPSVEAVRDGRMPEIRRVWLERTKKASKDADLAVVVAWLVAFPKRPFYGQIGAADRAQASIIRDRLTALLHHNPWLNERVELVGNVIRSRAMTASGKQPLCRFDIMSADVSGAHGGTPDLLILNELSHIRNFEFALNLLDNAEGVAQGMVMTATNAGIKGSPSWMLRKVAIASDAWATFILDRPAPWHSKEGVEDARNRNTPSRFKRLWQGIWVMGTGDALDDADLKEVFVIKRPILTPEPGWVYLLGLDLGVSKDHAGLAVVGLHEKKRQLKVVNWKRWDPQQSKAGRDGKKRVDLDSVRAWCKNWYFTYRAVRLIYDPHQAALMVQDLQRANVLCKEMTFSSAVNLHRMASCLVQVVTSKQITAYDDEYSTLAGDFGKFNIVERQYGCRLEAVSDATGHADVGTAVVVTLPAAVDFMNGSSSWLDGDDDLGLEDDSPLTDDEVADLPMEFKELFDDDSVFEKRLAQADDDDDDLLDLFDLD